MSTKNAFIGTTKRLVGEILGDGSLAEEGSRQTEANVPLPSLNEGMARDPRHTRSNASDPTVLPAPVLTEHERFALLLGHAALNIWSDLPRDAQERLFAAAVDDGIIANSLAVFLHDRHPKTAHPPKPTQFV